LAGDVSPIDVITHLPVTCEELGIPYVYVPSREDLGTAGNTKRPTSVVLVSMKNVGSQADTLKELMEEVKAVMPDFS
jgi:H/ACA ribonucleoprotein complex subunit 2